MPTYSVARLHESMFWASVASKHHRKRAKNTAPSILKATPRAPHPKPSILEPIFPHVLSPESCNNLNNQPFYFPTSARPLGQVTRFFVGEAEEDEQGAPEVIPSLKGPPSSLCSFSMSGILEASVASKLQEILPRIGQPKSQFLAEKVLMSSRSGSERDQ